MSSKAHAERLARALESTGLAEAVSTAHAESRINVLCRVSTEAKAKWLDLLRKMLLATEAEQGEAHSWAAHFCQHYFLKEVDKEKRLVYGWNLSIQSTSMTHSLDFLIRTIRGEEPRQKPKNELEEMEMTGVMGERGKPNERGRGAYTVGGKNDFKPFR